MLKLAIEKRELTGKKVKDLRATGEVPAAIYGPKLNSTALVLNSKEFQKIFQNAGHNKLIDVEVDGKHYKSLIKEVQHNPVTHTFVHVSLYAVDMDKELVAEVPVEVSGFSPAVKNNLGFLEQPFNMLKVRCLPAKLPGKIEVNIDTLENVGDAIRVADLKLEEGVEVVIEDTNTNIVFIAAPQKQEEEEKPAEAAAEGEAAAAPAAEAAA